MVGRIFLLGWPIFRGELSVLGNWKINGWNPKWSGWKMIFL